MIHIVDADDWVALYKDDVLVYQGHSIPQDILLNATGAEYSQEWYEPDEDFLEFPESYAEWQANESR